jgi:nitroimidazol reductase NimA-like FMN-containing flavoprotein (pyridoxamine 5'-phosphate oxidase superfamily)
MPNIDQRTGLEILDPATCWDLLARHEIGRLAVLAGRRPDIFPVNYRVFHGDVLIRTAPGTKLAAAVLGGPVAFEIDGVNPEDRSGWSVVVHGTAHEVERMEDLLAAEGSGLESWVDAPKQRWVRVVADEVSGRRIPS